MNRLTNIIYALSLSFSTLIAQEKVHHYHAPTYTSEWSAPSVHPDRIVLNLTEDPSNSMNVAWRTSIDTSTAYAEIAIATAAPKFWRNAIRIKATTETLDLSDIPRAGVVSNYHSVNFGDLEANTTYGYRVGDGDHWSEWIHFKTASKSQAPFSFLYVGDAQNYVLELWSRLIRQGYKSNPDASFIIHAGDLINNANSDRQWHEWFEAGSFIHSMVPSISIPGNHEYAALNDGEARQLSLYWRPQFNLPLNGPDSLAETTFYVDYQNTRFIGLNTNVDNAEQVVWLENVLKNNPNKWTIATFHHPLFSASGGRDNAALRNILKPLFDKYHVDLVLQGHDHSYARGRVSPPEYNLMSGVNKLDQTGTVYVVSVSGGKMYNIRENAWEGWEADRERAAENTQLIQSISIDGDRLSYESITATGELYDAFDIIKNESGPNTFVELRGNAIPARFHNNTVPYYDSLPLDLEQMVKTRYVNHEVLRINQSVKDGQVIYNVRLRDAAQVLKNISIDLKGNIIER